MNPARKERGNQSTMNHFQKHNPKQIHASGTATTTQRFSRYFSTALLAFSLVSAQAQDSQPKPIETPLPSYPAALSDTDIDGTVVITATVKADGSISDAAIKSADHPAFGEAAMKAILSWQFAPATKGSQAIDAKVAIPFEFTAPAHQRINDMLNRKVYRPIAEHIFEQKDLGKKLKVAKKASPQYPSSLHNSGIDAKVRVKFVVAPDGSTLNPEVLDKPNKEFALPAITAVANTMYKPPMKDGKGVYAQTTITLRFEESEAVSSVNVSSAPGIIEEAEERMRSSAPGSR